jgi:hypothetical protein
MTTEPPVTSITQNTLTLCLRYGEFAMTCDLLERAAATYRLYEVRLVRC